MTKFGLTTNEIKLTPAAIDYLRTLLAQNNAAGLRLSVLSGKGCGGNEYDLQLATAAGPDDETLRVDDVVQVFIPVKDTLKLFGTTVDYRADELGNTRLVIDNPNEKGRCGCGVSVVF